MSKIGNYYIELTEQANELGFESVEEALSKGYEIVKGDLVEVKDEQTKAHEAWLEERKTILGDLVNLYIGYCRSGKSDTTEAQIISRAVEFISKGEQ